MPELMNNDTLFRTGIAAAAQAETDTVPADNKAKQTGGITPPQFDIANKAILLEKLPVKPFEVSVSQLKTAEEMDSEDWQELLDEQAEHHEILKAGKAAFREKAAKAGKLAFIAVCLYMVFLTYGAMTTKFVYNEEAGRVYPQAMSVEELKYAAQFNGLYSYYIRARNLYEETLTLDVKLKNFPEDAVFISTEYEALLDTVAKLAVDLSAENYDTSYNQIYGQLMRWIQTDSAVYIQNISAAIAYDDIEKANNAALSREQMYNSFMGLTENVASLGRTIKGAETGDIYEWSPEWFVNEVVTGYGG